MRTNVSILEHRPCMHCNRLVSEVFAEEPERAVGFTLSVLTLRNSTCAYCHLELLREAPSKRYRF